MASNRDIEEHDVPQTSSTAASTDTGTASGTPLSVQEPTKIEREYEKLKNIPHRPSKGAVIIKWVVTLLLGALLLGCVTESKIAIVSLSEQMNRGERSNIFQLFVMLQMMAVVPHIINFFRGVWAGGFRRDMSWPTPRGLLLALSISFLESTGLCLFIFKVPGLFKPSSVFMLMNCVFLLPTLANLVRKGDQHTKKWKVMFCIALVLELGGIALTYFMLGGQTMDKVWAFSGVTLLSICWIPEIQQYLLKTKENTEHNQTKANVKGNDNVNIEKNESTERIQTEANIEGNDNLGHTGSVNTEDSSRGGSKRAPTDNDRDIRIERKPWKLTIFMSFWKALFTFGISLLLFRFFLFDKHPSMSDYINGWGLSGLTSKQIYYFVANIVTSITGYMVAYVACTTCMQRGAFSLPLFLATPLAVVLATVSSLCTRLFDPAIGSNVCSVESTDTWYLIGATSCLVLAAGVSIGWSLFRSKSVVMLKEGQLFWVPMYNPVLLEQWLMLIRRYEHNDENHEDPVEKAKNSRIIICTTMYRETESEMKQLLESIQQVNLAQSKCERHFESHIFFDGGVKGHDPTEFVLQLVSLVESTLDVEVKEVKKKLTPYGMSLNWKLKAEVKDSGMDFKIHLKDNTKVKSKKRWSQVMYMSYVLDCPKLDDDKLKDTYILTTDADVKFTPDSVEALLDLMTRDQSVGAVCARTHPLGSGPMVWYQVFEYAIGHWFQKAAEHVIGSVLCSPGCFSVYRCKAIKDVMKTYATNVEHALEFLTKDMGEDRWLCTLMLQSGWRIEYCAASKNSTHCPKEFDEFFKQRRRWVVSTLANLMLLIKQWNIIAKLNHRVSFVFLLYQAVQLFAILISPSSVILVVSGGLYYGWNCDPIATVVLQVILCLVFVVTCLFASGETQLNVAKLLTFVYAIVMTATLVGTAVQVVSDYIEPDTGTATILTPGGAGTYHSPPVTNSALLNVLTGGDKTVQTSPFPWSMNTTHSQLNLLRNLEVTKRNVINDKFPLSTTTLYLALMATLFLITGLLHLGEVFVLRHGLCYILFLPSGYLILTIYSICNITDISWGTREAETKFVVSWHERWQMFMRYFKSVFFCCFEQKPEQTPEMETVSFQTDFTPNNPFETSRATSTCEAQTQTERISLIESSEPGTNSAVSDGVHIDSDEEELCDAQIKDVEDWLPNEMKRFANNFKIQGFENTMLIAGMTETDLIGVGISGKGAKRYLMEKIKRLPEFNIQAEVPKDVEDWLSTIGLIQYKSNFFGQQIKNSKNMEILKSFGRTEIETELNIKMPGHVKRLMSAIQKLRNPTEVEKLLAVNETLDKLETDEFEFWEKLKGLCLSPQATAYGLHDYLYVKLEELRNRWLMYFAVSNFLWLILIMTLASKGELLAVVNSNPVGLVILAMFSLVLVIQFLAMLVHRVTTLTHFLGRAPHSAHELGVQ